MLSAQAYSFQRQARLAISLSWVGGCVNVVAFLACTQHFFVSHVTGTLTQLARLLAEDISGGGSGVHSGPGLTASYFFFLGCMFFSGALASGYMLEGARRRGIQSKFILPLAVEALLLGLFIILADAHAGIDSWLAGIPAFAMGVQNATITKISGAVVRSTHVTGVLTDLGLESMQFLMWYNDHLRRKSLKRFGRVMRVSRKHPSALRLLLLGSIVGSFFFGAVVGTLGWLKFGNPVLLAPICFLGFIILQDFHRPIADIKEIDITQDPELNAHDIMHSLLPPELGVYRFAHHQNAQHRAPDFQQWIERLPQAKRVVILAFSPMVSFDSNAILDLEHAVEKLHSAGRELILAGITPPQYKALAKMGYIEKIGAENIYPDMEFAIAAGMEWVKAHKAKPQS